MKTKIISITIIAILLIGSGIGYYIYQDKAKQNEIDNKLNEISKSEKEFSSTENRETKFDILKSTFEQMEEYEASSSKYEEIRKAILTNVDRGVTMLHGQTGYLLENTEVLINVISTRELVQVERIVKSIDEDAFMIISNVHEVQGRGFNLEKEYIEK